MATNTTPSRKLFMFNMKKDIVLLKEIVAVNPFKRAELWREVLLNFNRSIKEMGLKINSNCGDATERTLTDRLAMLISKFRKDELTSLRASDTDEEVTDRMELIREVVAIKEAVTSMSKQKKEKEEEEQAKIIRKRAMGGLVAEGEKPVEKIKRKAKSLDAMDTMISYLQGKNDNDIRLRKKEIELTHERSLRELKLKEKELELKERELGLRELNL